MPTGTTRVFNLRPEALTVHFGNSGRNTHPAYVVKSKDIEYLENLRNKLLEEGAEIGKPAI